MRSLAKPLRRIRARKKLLVFDACQSGAAATGEVLVAVRGAQEVDAIKRLARAEGIAILSASTKRDYAYEVEELGHGLFTYAVVKALQGDAAFEGERHVSVYGLLRYVDRQLPLLSRRFIGTLQLPTYSTQGQDYPLVALETGDKPLVGEAERAKAPKLSTTGRLPDAVQRLVRSHLEARKAAALTCVDDAPALAIRATIGQDGVVLFAPRSQRLRADDAECVRIALGSLKVAGGQRGTLVHALAREP